MRFERLWSTGRQFWDWPLVRGSWRLSAARQNWFAASSVVRVWRSWLSEVVSDYCARHAHCSRHDFWTEGMMLVRLVCNDYRRVPEVRPRFVRLFGEGDCHLLPVLFRGSAACGTTQYSGLEDISEEWQLTINATRATSKLQRTS